MVIGGKQISNIIKIRHGTNPPAYGDISNWELGWCDSDNKLYFCNNQTIIPISQSDIEIDESLNTKINNLIFPIGYVFITDNINFNPNTNENFPGDWEILSTAKGRLMRGQLANKSGTVGGQATISNSDFPSHTHALQLDFDTTTANSHSHTYTASLSNATVSHTHEHDHTGTISQNTGHNHSIGRVSSQQYRGDMIDGSNSGSGNHYSGTSSTNGAHTHTVTVDLDNTEATISHTHTLSTIEVIDTKSHTHNISINVDQKPMNSKSEVSIIPKSYPVIFWRRIA